MSAFDPATWHLPLAASPQQQSARWRRAPSATRWVPSSYGIGSTHFARPSAIAAPLLRLSRCMHRFIDHVAPNSRIREQYRLFVASLIEARQGAPTCAALMQCWLDEVAKIMGATPSAVGPEWWTIQCQHEYLALRRTRQARDLVLKWTSADLQTKFRYRDSSFTVQLDPLGQPRAWRCMTIVRTEGRGQHGLFTLQSSRGERQRLLAHVYMTMVEEARRGIDSMTAVPLGRLRSPTVEGLA